MQSYAIDIGNTRIKSAHFDDENLKEIKYWSDLNELRNQFPKGRTIISSVAYGDDMIKSVFPEGEFFHFTQASRIPITIDYETPSTLGIDRVASVVGAHALYSGDSLVIDMGSCITYDFIDSEGVYRGGAISPGVSMRLKSMNHYTANLPDVSTDWTAFMTRVPGKSTESNLLNGAIRGVMHEIEGFIRDFGGNLGKINILMTGGDSSYFESKIKPHIFVRPNLVLIGLNRILLYNEAS